jgi:hypothetical protein
MIFLCVTIKDGTLIHVQTLTLLALNAVSMFVCLMVFNATLDHCLSFCPFSFCHCIVCPSIYGI